MPPVSLVPAIFRALHNITRQPCSLKLATFWSLGGHYKHTVTWVEIYSLRCFHSSNLPKLVREPDLATRPLSYTIVQLCTCITVYRYNCVQLQLCTCTSVYMYNCHYNTNITHYITDMWISVYEISWHCIIHSFIHSFADNHHYITCYQHILVVLI